MQIVMIGLSGQHRTRYCPEGFTNLFCNGHKEHTDLEQQFLDHIACFHIKDLNPQHLRNLKATWRPLNPRPHVQPNVMKVYILQDSEREYQEKEDNCALYIMNNLLSNTCDSVILALRFNPKYEILWITR